MVKKNIIKIKDYIDNLNKRDKNNADDTAKKSYEICDKILNPKSEDINIKEK